MRLLERSYFCLFFLKGLIKVLLLDLNETSVVENSLPATSNKSNCLNGLQYCTGNTNKLFH